MTSTLTTGSKGEDLAFDFLLSKGLSVLERNWRHKHKEIDLIATDGSFVRIVEVKCRSGARRIEPVEAVTKAKQKTLIVAADAYIRQKKIDLEVRFDIISIVISSEEDPYIDYLPDAFYPVLKH